MEAPPPEAPGPPMEPPTSPRPPSEPPAPPLAPILNRVLPGGCLTANQGTLAWGQDNLLAYGAHSTVVVVDPATLQAVQCLTKHRSPVAAVAWGRVEGARLQLASADTSGEVGGSTTLQDRCASKYSLTATTTKNLT